MPRGIRRRDAIAQLDLSFNPPGIVETNFPPIDHPDVQCMLSEAWVLYAGKAPMLYRRESLWESWALEWAALFEGARREAPDTLTAEARGALITMFNATRPKDMPVWQRIIAQLDMIAGRRRTEAGFALIRPVDEKFWRPPTDDHDERGRPCLVIPIWSGTKRFGPRYDRKIECSDLIAVDPKIPLRWRVRTGFEPILGDSAELEAAYDYHLPVRLCRSPLGWLKRGGLVSGCFCVLDWASIEAELLLTQAFSIVTEDETHASELYKRMKKLMPKPKPPTILIDDREVAA